MVYDGTCSVCSKFVTVLTDWDKQGILELTPSQAAGARARFPWIPDRAYEESVQLIRTSDGKTWQGAAALEQLLNVLPKGGAFSWVFHIQFVRRFAEWFYRWFARNRYRLRCGKHCQYRPLDGEYEAR